jgi:hypothetical protein
MRHVLVSGEVGGVNCFVLIVTATQQKKSAIPLRVADKFAR